MRALFQLPVQEAPDIVQRGERVAGVHMHAQQLVLGEIGDEEKSGQGPVKYSDQRVPDLDGFPSLTNSVHDPPPNQFGGGLTGRGLNEA